MKTGRFVFPIIAALGVVFVAGCGKELEAQRTSNQRYFLEQLILKPVDFGADVCVEESYVLAHNGFGMVDVGGLVRQAKEPDPAPAAEAPEAAKREDAESAPAAEVAKAPEAKESEKKIKSDRDIRKQIESIGRIKEFLGMVKPKGDLEGYAEVVYRDGDADAEGERRIVCRYYLTRYPVDYLGRSEVSAAAAVEPINPETKKLDESLQSDEASAAVEPVAVATEPVVIEPLPEAEGTGLQVRVLGLRVAITAPGGQALLTQGVADAIARRLQREIDTAHAAIREVQAQREQQKPHGDLKLRKLGPFSRHLKERINLEDEEYRIFTGEF